MCASATKALGDGRIVPITQWDILYTKNEPPIVLQLAPTSDSSLITSLQVVISIQIIIQEPTKQCLKGNNHQQVSNFAEHDHPQTQEKSKKRQPTRSEKSAPPTTKGIFEN